MPRADGAPGTCRLPVGFVLAEVPTAWKTQISAANRGIIRTEAVSTTAMASSASVAWAKPVAKTAWDGALMISPLVMLTPQDVPLPGPATCSVESM